MNFLGHFYLSQHDSDLLVGNFIADFVKGKKYQKYPEKIAKGIMMHRHIDEFTDSHRMIRMGRKRLFPIYRHYASVIMDMYYDHFLARFWRMYSDQPLDSFSQDVYSTIESYWHILPEKSRYMFPYMKSGNWLLRYTSTEGIDKSLTGMSRRINNNSKLEFAVQQLREDYQVFQSEFEVFLPEARQAFKSY